MKLTASFSFAVATALAFLASPPDAGAQKKSYAAPRQITVPEGLDPELVKDAGGKAVDVLLAELIAKKDLPVKAFAVIPLEADVDGSYFTDKVRDRFAVLGGAAGLSLFTRMDDDWNKILEEIATGERIGDTMDSATVQKFGRIQGVQGLITGKVVSVSKDGDDVKVRFNLRAFEVETGRQLWGGETLQYGRRGPSERNVVEQLQTSGQFKPLLIGAGILIAALLILFRVIGAFRSAARPR